MRFRSQELTVCDVEEVELIDFLDLLKQRYGEAIVSRIDKSGEIDVSTLLRVCACTELTRQLSGVPGFDSVARQIAHHPGKSVWEPKGAWFQLVVAHVFQRSGLEVHLEYNVEGFPKDVYLTDHKLIVECKSFDFGGRQKTRLDKFLRTGKVEDEPSGEPKGFTTGVFLWPPPPGLPARWVLTDNYKRFISNALAEKNKQLVDGHCNIIAVSTERIAHNQAEIEERVKRLLESGAYPRVSGFLLVELQPVRR